MIKKNRGIRVGILGIGIVLLSGCQLVDTVVEWRDSFREEKKEIVQTANQLVENVGDGWQRMGQGISSGMTTIKSAHQIYAEAQQQVQRLKRWWPFSQSPL